MSKSARLEIRLTAEEHARWAESARIAGLPLAAWLRIVANQATGKAIRLPAKPANTTPPQPTE